jgi:periplasmic protein TonB
VAPSARKTPQTSDPKIPAGRQVPRHHRAVAFRAIIGKDGLIQTLELVEGPLALYESARDAVIRWQYKPTLLNGDPVAVETVIDVNYTLN